MCSAVCYRISIRCGDGGRCAGANASTYAFSDAFANIFADGHPHAITCVVTYAITCGVTYAVAYAVVRREDDGSGARGLHAEWWVLCLWTATSACRLRSGIAYLRGRMA